MIPVEVVVISNREERNIARLIPKSIPFIICRYSFCVLLITHIPAIHFELFDI